MPGINLERAQHSGIVDHGRIHIDQIDQHRILIDEGLTEHDLRHSYRILGTLGRRDRAHERLIRIFDMAVDHIVMAFVNRQINRLAERSAGMMEIRQHVSQFGEVAEVLDRSIAPPLIKIADERRPIDRSKHHCIATNLYIPRRIAGMLDKRGGRRLNNFTQ